MVSTIGDFARYGQMLLDGGRLDGKAYLSPATFAAMSDRSHIGPGSGVARNFTTIIPGDGFGFGYGFGVRTDPGNADYRRRRVRSA